MFVLTHILLDVDREGIDKIIFEQFSQATDKAMWTNGTSQTWGRISESPKRKALQFSKNSKKINEIKQDKNESQ